MSAWLHADTHLLSCHVVCSLWEDSQKCLCLHPPVLCVLVGLQPCLTAATLPRLCDWADRANEGVKSMPSLSAIVVTLLLL